MSDVLTEAVAAAQRREGELLPTLEGWVRQNSFSRNLAGVNALGDQLSEAFDFGGLSLERRKGHDVGDHFCWRSAAWDRAEPSDRLVLVGHHDTVFPPDTFEVWERDGDLLRGPGVLDMKGGLLVIRTALAALADAGALSSIPVAVVCVGDEEIGSPDSRPFLEEVARGAGAALVFEAGRVGDLIITQRKGTGRFNVEVKGVAAHAGNHHADGVNAIRALARFIDQVEDKTDYDAGTTVNVGTVEGGSSANTVAARAACEIDFRFVDPAAGEALVVAVDRLGREIAQQTGATFKVLGGIRRPPLVRTDGSVALYRRYAAACEPVGLGTDECPLIGGGSDANTLSAVGVPAIDGMGPRGRGFHTHDEFIEVSSLPLKIEALIRFVVDYAGVGD